MTEELKETNEDRETKMEVVKKKKQIGFEELGVDPRLVRALHKEGITMPTAVQSEGIPLILEGKDVVGRANTGSGKTYTYVLPLLQKLFSESNSGKIGPSAIILVPTRELCQQICTVVQSLLDHCSVKLKIAKLLNDMRIEELKTELAWHPDILVSTPACISKCLSRSIIQGRSISDSLKMLVLDEGDLLLSFGYEGDIKNLIPHVSQKCQRLLMTASPSDSSTGDDVEKLKKLVLQNPYILTVTEEVNDKDCIVPKSIQQFSISCKSCDKMLHILALLKLEVILKKVLIFVNSIDMAYRLKLFLEQFSIRSAVLNAELPQNSRHHILEAFNAGIFDYLITTDIRKTDDQSSRKGQHKEKHSKKNNKQKADVEFGVVRGIDFKNVFTVINYDMPRNAAGYVHRVGRTGRAHNTGSAISLVCPEDEKVNEEIKLLLGSEEEGSSSSIEAYPFLTKEAVEGLRYRAEDVSKGVTKLAIRESRAQDLRKEILNSTKLKSHFKDNPKDLELLKHDKELSKKPPPPHLREIPEYLLDPETKKASKFIKLTQAAIRTNFSAKKYFPKKKGFKSKDPLKSLSLEKKKRSNRDMKRKGGQEAEAHHSKKSKKHDF
ncbi:ATP dependent RNA helicase [Zostera marina]|uniref:RNA helicase n=1 Tax=Zostera marina TaxID=29655 RepID=A0A0K9NZA7_ZOSMR|nr:ATP dependent RNA helicase [Zostera marina]